MCVRGLDYFLVWCGVCVRACVCVCVCGVCAETILEARALPSLSCKWRGSVVISDCKSCTPSEEKTTALTANLLCR
jgi:hypothetical protein